MVRIALIVLLAAGLAAGAFLLLRSGDGVGGLAGAGDREAVDPPYGPGIQAPSLTGTSQGPKPRAPETPPERPATPPPGGEVVLRVRVVDEESGAALPGARVFLEKAGTPCPRLAQRGSIVTERKATAFATGISGYDANVTDAEGMLAIRDGERGWDLRELSAVDVFAAEAHHAPGAACHVTLPGEVTVRMPRGLVLRGRVLDRQGRALAEAQLKAGPRDPLALPEYTVRASTSESGRFALEGLPPEHVGVSVQKEGWYALVVEDEDPADARERTYTLVPAYTLRFRLRSDDGRDLVTPTLEARAPTRPPFQAVQILRLTQDKTNDGVLAEGVALPATLGAVDLEVKAEGYAAWRAAGEPVPPEGGERTYLVTLKRDAGQGSVRIRLEDERGQALPYAELRPAPPSILPLERQDLAGGIVYEAQDDLRFPSLPPGRYRFGIAAFAHAPALVDATVVGGTESEVRVTLRAAAKLRVKFRAPTARVVKFQVVQGRTVVVALPETPTGKRADPAAPDEPLAAGEGGLLLGGLATGTYVVEVLSDDLLPSRTSVQVREGETEEVEITVQPR